MTVNCAGMARQSYPGRREHIVVASTMCGGKRLESLKTLDRLMLCSSQQSGGGVHLPLAFPLAGTSPPQPRSGEP
jgi:hypothetical protein